MSSPTRIAPSLGKGNGLFAAAPIPAGTAILTIPNPLITVPSDAHLSTTCSHCMAWKPSPGSSTYYSAGKSPLLMCAGCKITRYCDQTCQRASWPNPHRPECRLFPTLPALLPSSLRCLLRLLHLHPTLPAQTHRAFATLATHATSFRASPKWSELVLLANGVHAYSRTTLPEPLVLRLYCVLLTNTLTLTTPTLDPIGLCFDPAIAVVNHSCDPNAAVVFEGRKLQLRALADIDSGEEVTLPYIDTTFPTETRQEELAERWFFTCSCPRCSTPTPTPEPPTTLPTPETLEEAYSSGWGMTQQPVPKLHQDRVEAALAGKRWEEAMRHQLLLVRRVYPGLYSQPFHPVRVVGAFVAATLVREVAEGGEGGKTVDKKWKGVMLHLLREAAREVVKSHGADSAFAKVVNGGLGELEEGARVVDVEEEEEGVKEMERIVDGLIKELRRR